MKILIKHMVCQRCIDNVKVICNQLNIPIMDIHLGEISVDENVPLKLLEEALKESGFEMIQDQKSEWIERVKRELQQYVYSLPQLHRFILSEFIETKCKLPYLQVSQLFSSIESVSLERYYLLLKIERAKELIRYNEMSLSEIAYHLDYSSMQHFSKQFKLLTGITAKEFKGNHQNRRLAIDKIITNR